MHRLIRRSTPVNGQVTKDNTANPVSPEKNTPKTEQSNVDGSQTLDELLVRANLPSFNTYRQRRQEFYNKINRRKKSNELGINDMLFLKKRRRRLLAPGSGSFPNIMLPHLRSINSYLLGSDAKSTRGLVDKPIVQLPITNNNVPQTGAGSQAANLSPLNKNQATLPNVNVPPASSSLTVTLAPIYTPASIISSENKLRNLDNFAPRYFPAPIPLTGLTPYNNAFNLHSAINLNNIANPYYDNAGEDLNYYEDSQLEHGTNGEYKLVPLKMFNGDNAEGMNQPWEFNSNLQQRNAIMRQGTRQIHNTSASNSGAEECRHQPLQNNVPVLEKIMDELEDIKNERSKCSGKEGLPCRVTGSWVSHIGGVRLDLTVNSSGSVHVLISETTPPKKGLLTVNWTANGAAPFPRGGPFTLMAMHVESRRLAVFVGQCRVCSYAETITGWWLFGNQAKDCREIPLSGEMHPDLFHREVLHSLREEKLGMIHVKPVSTTEAPNQPLK